MISPASFALAYALDWLIGDPGWLPHPVRWMGRMIKGGERLRRRFGSAPGSQFIAGLALTGIVVGMFAIASWIALLWLRRLNPALAFIVSVYLAATTLATRSLLDEARAVRHFLVSGDLLSARQQVSRIVGRDTHELDEPEITRAVIETLAESAADGIVAPMFYLATGGLPAALAYKAINTLDSMIGHRDRQYEFFGKCAARLDDIANFIPARVTALLFICAAWTLNLNWRGACWITWRDGAKHSSPNAGRPEAAMAGALGVRVGGTNFYDGERHSAQYLGDVHNPLDDQALRNALRLTCCVSLLMFALCLSVQLLVDCWNSSSWTRVYGR